MTEKALKVTVIFVGALFMFISGAVCGSYAILTEKDDSSDEEDQLFI